MITTKQNVDSSPPGARPVRWVNAISIVVSGILVFQSTADAGLYRIDASYENTFWTYLNAADCNWQDAEAIKVCIQKAVLQYDLDQSNLALLGGMGALVVATIMLALVGFRACVALFAPSKARLVVSFIALTVFSVFALLAVFQLDIEMVLDGKLKAAVVIIILGTLSQDVIPLCVGRSVRKRSGKIAQAAG